MEFRIVQNFATQTRVYVVPVIIDMLTLLINVVFVKNLFLVENSINCIISQ